MSIEIREIMMPVQALNEYCKHCPDLEINISRYEMSGLAFETENKNILACKHAQRCKQMMLWMQSKQEGRGKHDT